MRRTITMFRRRAWRIRSTDPRNKIGKHLLLQAYARCDYWIVYGSKPQDDLVEFFPLKARGQ